MNVIEEEVDDIVSEEKEGILKSYCLLNPTLVQV